MRCHDLVVVRLKDVAGLDWTLHLLDGCGFPSCVEPDEDGSNGPRNYPIMTSSEVLRSV
jgi:hypothetical protein